MLTKLGVHILEICSLNEGETFEYSVEVTRSKYDQGSQQDNQK